MAKVYPVVGAVISLVALIVLAIGASTNKWIVLDQTQEDMNPIVVNSKLGTPQSRRIGVTSSTADISYSVAHFGLWFGCHKEHRGALSCSFIRAKCFSNVCWVRQTTVDRTITCMDERVAPVRNCIAYQFVRLFVVIATVLLLLGVCTQFVSVIAIKRSLAMLAGFIVFASGLFVLMAFGIFFSEEWIQGRLTSIGRIGWSFILFIVSGPLAMLGGITSCIAARQGLRHKEYSEYSASNY